jgi:uncharacterized protein (TIGR03437 family)
MDRVFQPSVLLERMKALRAMIRPYVESSRQEFVSLLQFDQAMDVDAASGLGGPNGASPGLEPFLYAREASIRSQLGSSGAATVSAVASATSLAFSQEQGKAATTQKVSLTLSGSTLPIGYSVSASTGSGGSWLTVSPASGVGPLELTVTAGGASVAAGVHTGNVTIYVPAASPSIIHIPISLTVGGAAIPLITSVSNSASYVGGGVSPGEIVSIFGSNLGPAVLATGGFSNQKWSTTVGGTQATFDGLSAPVLFAATGQVGVVVPFGVTASQTKLRVIVNGQTSAESTLSVAATTPGIFTAGSTGTGQAAVLNQDGTINSAAAPAPKGSTVSVFLTGLGVTNPGGTDGAPGPRSPFAQTQSVAIATVGGLPSTVTFSGLAPDVIQGLYQVNLTIPASVASGAQAVLISAGGKSSQPGVTLAVQ